ncbi:deoxyribodipyrimidine photo-lyase photorepair [Arctopsyche grandis]|uniref:deoxyribodipyrimidine photo-lyase photorepair n=1 Tax=Arctopsyche grandis TaxID=121162 RepID=UPI00406D8768
MLCLTVFAQNLHRPRVISNSSRFGMASAPKKPRVEARRGKGTASSSGKGKEDGGLAEEVNLPATKSKTASVSSVLEFPLNKKRIRVLSKATLVKEDSAAILYWCSRDPRVQDNWAALYAQKLALKNNLPLHVCFCLLPRFLDATHRHFHFLLKGLEEIDAEYAGLNVNFHLLEGSAADTLPKFVQDFNVGAVVCDFSPLRGPVSWAEDVKKTLPKDVPLMQVDAHNIVPCWIASDKLEYSARTIRNKINSKLAEYLTEFPPLIKHPYKSERKPEKIDWDKALESRDVDKSVGPCSWAEPGTKAGLKTLEEFCTKRLRLFSTKRNDPTVNALSNLSPWFHFGQISVQRAVLCVQKYKSKYGEGVSAFCEEAIVRRELADNFCYYNKNYDSIEGASNWAQKTLNDHKKDKREYVYTTEELRDAITHDDLWNSAQKQLVTEGKLHGFLRMYWAKKILEWTPTPEKALQDAIYLNDRYSLDGRDPNGFVGCMWSICGVHDQGWAERSVFGKIRYMNYAGCKRKFDINAFIVRYGGKCHKYVPKK